MKKAILYLLVIMMILYGCQKTEQLDNLTEKIVKKTVSCLSEYGYSKNDKYVLEGPYRPENSDFPVIYELKINGKTEYYSVCSYSEEVPFGGLWEEFNDGYINVMLERCSQDTEARLSVSSMKKENQKINLNDYLVFAEDVVMDESFPAPAGDEVLEKLLDDVTELLPSLIENVSDGDKIGVTGPVTAFLAVYDDNNVIHLKPVENLKYLVCYNGRVLFTADVMGEDVWQFTYLGTENAYDELISNNVRFLIIREMIISESMEYDENMVPVIVRESFSKALEYLKNSVPYRIIKEKTITSTDS